MSNHSRLHRVRCGVHTTVMSIVRGEAETVLDTFPGLHFPVSDVECISIQMGDKLQGCRDIVPAVRTHDGLAGAVVQR